MHRRLLSAAAASALLLGLAACGEPTDGPVTTAPPSISVSGPSDGGDDVEPSDEGGSETEEPTAQAPDIPPPDPADYAGMDEHTPEGAEQAFRYYIAMSYWARQVGSIDSVQKLAEATCAECAEIESQIETIRNSGNYWSATSVEPYGSKLYDSEKFDHEVGYIYIVSDHSEPGEDGEHDAVTEQAYTAIGGMNWSENRWIVGGLSIQETESEL